MPALSQTLFRTSTILNTISIIGHLNFGFKHVYPALASIPTTQHNGPAKTSARVSYDLANTTLAMIALLNWQWSRTSGPTTMEEQIIFCAFTAASGLSTLRFVRAGLYGPLMCSLVAPACSVLGWYLA